MAPKQTTQESVGHLGFVGDVEYYVLAGQVYRAPLSAVFDVRTSARIGRWECSFEHWQRFGGLARVTRP